MGPRHCCRGISLLAGSLEAPLNLEIPAAALLPRNLVRRRFRPRMKTIASMGPRHCCRGISRPPQPGDASGWPLQWGRGIAAAESPALQAKPLRTDIPSMGPRHCCRGISKMMSWQPRHLLHLQWGRGIAAAESRECHQASVPVLQFLQWGRGIAAAESRRGTPRWGTRPRTFNGAAALLPRNLPGSKCVTSPRRNPSMGPRHCCRGISLGREYGERSRGLLQWGRGIAAAESRMVD